MELTIIGVATLALATSWRIGFHRKQMIKVGPLMMDGQYAPAQAILKRAVLVPPLGSEVNDWALLRNLLAYLEIQQGRHEEAQRLVDSILNRKGTLLPAIRNLAFDRIAELRAATGSPQESSSYRQQAEVHLDTLDRTSLSPPLLTSLGYFLAATGRYDRAADCMEEVVRKDWSVPAVYMSWTVTSRSELPQELKLVRCRRALKHALHSDVWKPLLLVSLNEALEHGNNEEALEICLSLAEIPDSDVRKYALVSKADVEWKLQRFDESARTGEQLESLLDPAVPGDLVILALQAFKKTDHQKCRTLLEQAEGQTALDPFRVLNALRLGEALKALQMAETGLAADETGTTFLTGAALSALTCLRVDKVKNYLARLEFTDPEASASLMAQLACIYEGNPSLAQKYDQDNSSDTLALYRGQFETAFSLSERLLRSVYLPGPGLEAQILHQKGCLLLWEKRWDEALRLFQKSAPLLVGAPLQQAYSELYQLLCRAGLSEDVESEVLPLQHRLEKDFSGHPRFQADLRFAVLDILSEMKNYPELLPRIDGFIEAEPRAFYRAGLLLLKAEASTATGSAEGARETLQLVRRTAPESFLDQRAKHMLDDDPH